MDKDCTRKKVYTNLTYEHKCKHPNRNSRCMKTYCNINKNFLSECKNSSDALPHNNNRIKRQKKEFNKIQHLLMIKSFSKLIKEVKIKSIYQKAIVNIILSGETKNQAFVSKSDIKQGGSLSSLLFNTNFIKQEVLQANYWNK